MKNFMQKTIEDKGNQKAFNPAPVTDYMTPADKLITFKPEMEVMDVVESLLSNKITGAPVLDSRNKLVGLIDDKDCLKVLFDVAYHNQPVHNSSVQYYMSNVMKTIRDNANIMEVADTFLTTKYKRLLVVDGDGQLVGQISRRDILHAIKDFNDSLE
ncbi:MAG: CBS domain-containing protein [Bacteroidota bacterium]